MKCPKCKAEMELVETVYAEIDRCTSCKGLWLDMLEYKDIMGIAKEIDIGDPEVGEKFDEVDEIFCPVCANSKMLKMVDSRQTHIHFESCNTCYGRFYDAGELTDLAEETFLDFIRDLFSHEHQ